MNIRRAARRPIAQNEESRLLERRRLSQSPTWTTQPPDGAELVVCGALVVATVLLLVLAS
jgi:hypothetical protein